MRLASVAAHLQLGLASLFWVNRLRTRHAIGPGKVLFGRCPYVGEPDVFEDRRSASGLARILSILTHLKP